METNYIHESVLICGAGHQGLAMAAHLSINGVEVSLWNRSYSHVKKIIENGNSIECFGIVEGSAHISKVSTDISQVIQKNILVTTPSSAHKDIAKTLAPYVDKETNIILNPGRTFGSIEFVKTLIESGVSAQNIPQVAETQSIIYTCRKKSDYAVHIFALKENIGIAGLGGKINRMAIPNCIRPYFNEIDSVIEISLSNIGMILHCAPVLMNIGWIESEVADFKYYYDGISESIARFLERMDAERVMVASKMGYKVETVTEWLKRVYRVEGKDLFSCIRNNLAYKEIDAPPTLDCRYLNEDIPNGLVPIEFLAKELEIDVPHISTVIDLGELVTNTSFRGIGRKYTFEEVKQYE